MCWNLYYVVKVYYAFIFFFQVSFPKRCCKPAFQCTVDLIVNSEVRQLIRFGGFVNGKILAHDDMHILDIGKLL